MKARKPSKSATLAKLGIHSKLKVPMWGSMMHVVWTESAHQGVKFLQTMFPNDDLGLEYCADSRTLAFVMPIDDWPWMVLPYDADADTIAHEAVHAGNLYLAAAGVGVTKSNDEPLAYFVGWLTGKLLVLQADVQLERAKRSHPSPSPATPRKPRSIRAAGEARAALVAGTASLAPASASTDADLPIVAPVADNTLQTP